MSTTIVMPQLGESVAEGVIGKWLKAEGDAVERDESIVEVITDKVNAEIPSPVAGIIERIAQPEGATVAVGQEIAVIASLAAGALPSALNDPNVTAHGVQRDMTASNNVGERRIVAERSQGEVAGVTGTAGASNGTRLQKVRTSPLVRRLAEEHAIDLDTVIGTGVGGRVSKADVLALIEGSTRTGSAAPTTNAVTLQPRTESDQTAGSLVEPVRHDLVTSSDEVVPLTPIRKIIAERMVLSTSTIPHAVTIVEVDVTNVVRFREAKKDEFRKREGVALSYVAFVVKASVESLKQYPDVNAEWGGNHVLRKADVNINIAVDTPDGLTTPVIHHADRMSMTGISNAIADLASRARQRKLRIEDIQGGTFTVNNTGALGSIWSYSIINPPQCGMLAAAAIVKRPVVVEHDGEETIAIRSMMNLSFSFDHRILDGGYASAFLNSVKDRLERWPRDYPLY